MTASAFVDALSGMKGILPGMMEHLKGLAPKLTEKEREETVQQFSSLSEQVEALERENNEMLAEGHAEMEELKKKELPKIKAAAEKMERSSAEAKLDKKLKNL